jgi:hypothetical protein
MQAELRSRNVNLRAEVLKVPHHGSDDVDREFIEGVAPLVSVISAGDEDARRDYLHPRASLLAMLGKARRGADATTFVTNLAAFDRWAGEAFRAVRDGDAWKPDLEHGVFYARERTAYGIIHVRTDGKRLLAVRRGARNDRYEAYAYEVAEDADMGMDWIFSSNSRRWSEGTLIAKATHFVFIESYQAPRSTAGTERLAGRART